MGITFIKGARCPVSDPANPHTLSEGVGENPLSGCFTCGKQTNFGRTGCHYRCITCNVEFHNFCHECPRKVRHIYHLQHPLTLIDPDDETKITIQEHGKSESIFKKCCDCCGGDLENRFYRCSICGFCLDLSCLRKSPPATITNPKSHHHPLVLFPGPFSLPCDACGLVDVSEPVYTCYQCNYMVHQSCISLPRVIKITRHPHRLSYTPYLPQNTLPCRICYKTVDIKYGQYSCFQEGCSFVAHSKCATHENVWDGSELEWEPEETIKTEDIEPFEKVGEDFIKYFCHEHNLKLHKYDKVRDSDKQCQACIFPIDSRDFYTCMQCDGFVLHEVCANLPRKLDHASHHHPLFLDPYPLKDEYRRYCSTCSQQFSGFQYKCSRHDCHNGNFKVDVRCVLVHGCFIHKCHEHPLFISTCFRSDIAFCCKACNGIRKYAVSRLQCTLCDFIMCYQCAIIPDVVCYKHDEHTLFLCYGGEVDDDMYVGYSLH